MENEKIKRGIVRILIANIINLIFSLGTNFLLPKYLSVDTYAEIKMYQLYVSYIAILQLGYSDGMYLAFGGKELNSIPQKELQKSISTMRGFQLAVGLVFSLIALLLGDKVLLIATITIFPQNVIAYYKNLFQAVGIFDKYSSIMNYTTGLTFLINMLLLFALKSDNYMFYISSYLLLTVVLCIKLEVETHSILKMRYSIKFFSLYELFDKIKSGFLLLLANFSSILLTSMDRWFTKILLTTLDFAQYSFSVSIENFLNIAVSPVTVTMYNYFCNNQEEKKVKNVLGLMSGFSCFLISSAFPIKFIIERLLDKYTASVDVIFYLFAAQLFLIIIRSTYANLYKAKKMQNRYFTKMCIVIIAGVIFNYVCYLIDNSKEAFAVGTLLSSILWFILCLSDFKDVKLGVKQIAFLGLTCTLFLVCKNINVFIGFAVYIVGVTVLMQILLPGILRSFISIIANTIRKTLLKLERR